MTSLLLAVLLAEGLLSANYLPVPPVVHTEETQQEERELLGLYTISAYTCSAQEGTAACISHHTAQRPVEGVSIASPNLPVGTVLEVEGLGRRVVDDLCRGCPERQMDVYMEQREDALKWGIPKKSVWVIREVN